mgnify:CR=1 FL=1
MGGRPRLARRGLGRPGTALVQERDRAVGRDLRTGAEKYVVEGVFCPWFGSTGGVAYCRDGRLSTAASTGTDVRAIEIGTGRSLVVHTAPGVWMVDPNPSTREGTTVVHLGAHGSGDEGILLGLREGKVSWVVTSTDAARCHPLTTMIGCTSPDGGVAYARDDGREVLRVDRWVSWLDDGYVVDERAGSVQTATAQHLRGHHPPRGPVLLGPRGLPDGGLRRPTVQQVLDAPLALLRARDGHPVVMGPHHEATFAASGAPVRSTMRLATNASGSLVLADVPDGATGLFDERGTLLHPVDESLQSVDGVLVEIGAGEGSVRVFPPLG